MRFRSGSGSVRILGSLVWLGRCRVRGRSQSPICRSDYLYRIVIVGLKGEHGLGAALGRFPIQSRDGVVSFVKEAFYSALAPFAGHNGQY